MKYDEMISWGIFIVLGLGLAHYIKEYDLKLLKEEYNMYAECVNTPVTFEMFNKLEFGERILLTDRACNRGSSNE